MQLPERGPLDKPQAPSWRLCEHCDVTFTTERASLQHQKSERHRKAIGECIDRAAACRTCGKLFNRDSDRLRHEVNQSCRKVEHNTQDEEERSPRHSVGMHGSAVNATRPSLVPSSAVLYQVTHIREPGLNNVYSNPASRTLADGRPVQDVRSELQALQQQQRAIEHVIVQIHEQNDTFFRQAAAMQALHDRHDNAVNAILVFLSTLFDARSIEA